MSEILPDSHMTGDDRRKRYQITLDCVHCGLCLPACPTYQLTGHEAASPRGRIVLMRAFEEGKQEATATFREHLESCLVCRACETACPSGVQFGTMMEEFRALYRGQLESQPMPVPQDRLAASTWQARLGTWLMLEVLPNPRRLRFLMNLLWFTQRSGLSWLARRSGVLGVLGLEAAEAMAPPVPSPNQRRPWAERLPPYGKQRARVLFLRGCVTPGLLPSMQSASLEVLRHNGCEVVTPPEQTCCGALHFHSGQRQAGLALLRKNLAAFDVDDFDAIVVNAAGCGSTLKEYDNLLGETDAQAGQAQAFAAKVRDISEFLVDLGLKPPPGSIRCRVAYDEPCHLLHGQGISDAPKKLIDAIPGVQRVALEDADRCCGSAGVYNLVHPQMAAELGAEKLQCIRRAQPDMVVTGNPGCILQIRNALQQAASEEKGVAPIEVLHPMELLLRAYV